MYKNNLSELDCKYLLPAKKERDQTNKWFLMGFKSLDVLSLVKYDILIKPFFPLMPKQYSC